MLSPPTVPRRLKACGYHNVVAEGNLIYKLILWLLII